jgi:hypothetical protein
MSLFTKVFGRGPQAESDGEPPGFAAFLDTRSRATKPVDA